MFRQLAGALVRRASLLFCMLALIGGCSSGPPAVENAEVSGKVLYRGQPLPGGKVTFVTVQGGFAHNGTIDENGNYKISAPVGDVLVSVDNRMLRTQKKGAKEHVLKRPGAEQPQALKGTYVALPAKYSTPSSSGLTYKVQPGPQTHDIRLD
jgi:hypothetical protein